MLSFFISTSLHFRMDDLMCLSFAARALYGGPNVTASDVVLIIGQQILLFVAKLL